MPPVLDNAPVLMEVPLVAPAIMVMPPFVKAPAPPLFTVTADGRVIVPAEPAEFVPEKAIKEILPPLPAPVLAEVNEVIAPPLDKSILPPMVDPPVILSVEVVSPAPGGNCGEEPVVVN